MLETILDYFQGSPLSLWGPFVVLLLCGLGLPVPEDIVLISAGALGVLGSKHLAVDLLYSDRALFESGRTATFGGEAHLGLLAFDDLLEAALTGCELTPFGALVLGDSEPLVMTAGDRAADPTRHAWVTTLLLPTGLIAAAVG